MARVLRVAEYDPSQADPQEVAELAQDMPDAHIDCRTFGHDFSKPFSAKRYDDGSFDRIRRCPRCHVLKIWELDRFGRPVKSPRLDYSETEDYLLPKGTGRLTGHARSAITLVSIQRETTGLTVSAGDARRRRRDRENKG